VRERGRRGEGKERKRRREERVGGEEFGPPKSFGVAPPPPLLPPMLSIYVARRTASYIGDNARHRRVVLIVDARDVKYFS